MKLTGKIDKILVKLKFTDFDKEKIYDLEIKEHKNKRSLNANSYAWSLLKQIADKMLDSSLSDVDLYRKYVKDLGIYKEITICDSAVETFIKSWGMNGIAWLCEKIDKSNVEGFSVLHAYYGSSSYNTSQMARLIKLIEEDCHALEIETLEEKKLNQLLESWGK